MSLVNVSSITNLFFLSPHDISVVNTAEGKYSHHENKLEIKDINSKMDGIIFQCSAENEIGLSEPESIQLNVLCNDGFKNY